MRLFKKKPKPIQMTFTDPDTGREYSDEMMPGTPEFAAGVKKMVDAALADVKKKLTPENWDALCTVMFACAYDDGEGIAQSVDGNNEQLLLLMAVTIHEMIEAEVERQKFIPNPQGGNQIGALLITKLSQYVNMLDRDDGKAESGIITGK